MTSKRTMNQFRWLAATLMLVAAMVVPSTAWAQNTITPTKPANGVGTEASPYQISSKEELYWFAGLVNGDASVCTGNVTQNTAACAKLTASITVNTGVLDASGNLAGDVSGFSSWTSIGNNYNNRYSGTFDGNGMTISGLYFNSSSTYNVGLFGYISGGTIKNVGIVDSYFNGREDVGGLCGNNQGTISDCYFFGSVSGNNYVGGLCGEMCNGSLSSCYFVGTVSGSSYTGAVCGYIDRATITNCFFNSDIFSGVAVEKNDGGTIKNVVAKTTKQFKSGEVAYQLNGDRDVWGQTINTNDYPIFGGSKVYATTGCVSYSNDPNHTGAVAHDFTHGTDGKCSNCGNYEEPVKDVNGVYQIDNFSKLYWFAQQVNSESRDINAVLTADITVNTGVLKPNGTLADDTNGFIAWTPIGNSTFPYIGNFDGQKHTISGLYFNDNTADNVGLFGYIGGVMNNGYIPCGSIKNVSIADSYFCGKDYVGGICGKSETNPINNCSNSGTVIGHYFVGGVCGVNNFGLVIDCSNSGMVSGDYHVGGVCGGNYYDFGTIQTHNLESGVIRNCSNTGEISGNGDVGGVCGKNAAKLEGCSNSGAISGSNANIGGVCGQSSHSGKIAGEIYNCHNTGNVTGYRVIGGVCGRLENDNIKNCYNKGNVTGTGFNVGGICGIGNYSANIYSSYNTGDVSGIDNVGGIGGYSILGYNCYNTGTISGSNNVGGLVGKSGYFYNCFSTCTVRGESNVGGINGGSCVEIINCYYDSDKFKGAASGGHCQYYINVCGKTTAQFKSGEVVYLLDALSDTDSSNDTGIDWGQTIGQDDFPVLGGQRVFATKGCTTYSNVEPATEKEHSFGDGDVCTACGSYRPAGKDANGVYQIGSVDDLYWFAQQVNSGNTEISAVLTADITINEGVLKADGTLADDPSGLKQWQPIAYYGRKAAAGTFDGNGHSISGLYVNDPIRSCVGMFANLSENATVKNLIIKDSYISGLGSVGGVCGYYYGTIANCGFTGAVSGNDHVGGLCGNSLKSITNCYFNGTVSGNEYVGGVCGYSYQSITNCYYLASEDNNKGGKTAAQFKSGEVAWLLNGSSPYGVWSQRLGVDDCPVIGSPYNVIKAAQDGQNGKNYWATFSNLSSNVELTVPSGKALKVYNAKVNNASLALAQRSDNRVAQGEGVLLKADCEYVNAMNTSESVAAAADGDNDLVATPSQEQTVTADDGYTLYRLTYNNVNSQEKLGFYLSLVKNENNEVDASSVGKKLKATPGKAYLNVATAQAASAPAGAAVRGFVFPGDDGETTGIECITVSSEELHRNSNAEGIYDLQGRKVSKPAAKGVYIKNNKLFLN